MTNPWPWLIASVVALAVGAGAYFYWDQQRLRPAAVAEAPPAPLPPVVQAPAEPQAVQHPIEAAPAAAREEALASLPRTPDPDGDLKDALVALFGRSGVFAFLNTDRFVQRVVATVDNLPREKASATLWPVQPAAGRFAVERRGEGSVIAPANAARYDAFVRFIDGIDMARAAAFYVRLYPALQRAYESLGYPGRHFNDRVVEVIDHLLETPEPAAPPRVVLTEVKGPLAPARPWVMYEFEDAALEARSAGQKILLRVGSEHARRLKARLAEFRRHVVRAGAPR
jgi:hypothetical protein